MAGSLSGGLAVLWDWLRDDWDPIRKDLCGVSINQCASY